MKLVESEQKIFIAGFSQGSSMALYTALNSNYKLGGAFCFSGYLFGFSKITNAAYIKIRASHGRDD